MRILKMEKKLSVNIIIEKELVDGDIVFIASSQDINVIAEGKTAEEAKEKFIGGVKSHLEVFPEEKRCLVEKTNVQSEMPSISKIFL